MDNQNILSCNDAKSKINNDSNVLILDVRSEEEYKEGHIPNSISLPIENIKSNISQIVDQKDKVILVYCNSGTRSTVAVDELINIGYTNVFNIGGISVCNYDTISEN